MENYFVSNFVDYAGYLPHGLMFYSGVRYDLFEPLTSDHNPFKYSIGWIPVLRPLSDLYKTINVDGEDIIPIVELAQIAFPHEKWKLGIGIREAIIASKEKVFYRFTWSIDYNGFTFETDVRDKRMRIENQHLLFDYLHKLKIDYRGLIDIGRAKSIHDFDINAYIEELHNRDVIRKAELEILYPR